MAAVIYRLRMDGLADSADQLEREFEGMRGHFSLAGYFEGFLGSMAFGVESVIESMAGSEEVDLDGGRFSARYKGRSLCSFRPGDFEPLRPHAVPDWLVFDADQAANPRPLEAARGISVGGGSAGVEQPTIYQSDARRDVFVLRRANVNPEDWIPEQRGPASAEEVLALIASLGNVRQVQTMCSWSEPDPKWTVSVFMQGDGPAAFYTESEESLRAAALAAYGRVREE